MQEAELLCVQQGVAFKNVFSRLPALVPKIGQE
jgi:hypothetical protein